MGVGYLKSEGFLKLFLFNSYWLKAEGAPGLVEEVNKDLTVLRLFGNSTCYEQRKRTYFVYYVYVTESIAKASSFYLIFI